MKVREKFRKDPIGIIYLQLAGNHSVPSNLIMHGAQLPRFRRFASVQPPAADERLMDDCWGKTQVQGSTAGPIDRHQGVAPPISLQVLLHLQKIVCYVL